MESCTNQIVKTITCTLTYIVQKCKNIIDKSIRSYLTTKLLALLEILDELNAINDIMNYIVDYNTLLLLHK